MEIPSAVRGLLTQLNQAGYAAYAVGGCVRDSLLGRIPNDWDICTSALPEETEALFSHCRVIETGIKHGTVTLLLDGVPYEITTFRQDGTYLDHRKPEQVQFVTSLREDLARRDFTINAMAADASGQVTDLFGGREDLGLGCIRCVGNPDTRFQEDALRILRGLRFAATLGFSIHPETAEAMEKNKALLTHISGERIYQELSRLLTGKAAADILSRYGSVLTPVLPELAPAFGVASDAPALWIGSLRAFSHAPEDGLIRWTLFLHELGAFSQSGAEDTHPEESAAIARRVFSRLKADSRTTEAVCTMIRFHHEVRPVSTKGARRWIAQFGTQLALPLLEVQRCDCLAQPPSVAQETAYRRLMLFREYVSQLLKEAPCCSCRDLKVSGRDVMAFGVKPGAQIGLLLNQLLEDVLEERCENDRSQLLSRLSFYISKADRKDIT